MLWRSLLLVFALCHGTASCRLIHDFGKKLTQPVARGGPAFYVNFLSGNDTTADGSMVLPFRTSAQFLFKLSFFEDFRVNHVAISSLHPFIVFVVLAAYEANGSQQPTLVLMGTSACQFMLYMLLIRRS